MTETLRLTALDLEHSIRKAGSVGKEVFHVFLRIVNDAGEDARQGEVGEMCSRYRGAMKVGPASTSTTLSRPMIKKAGNLGSPRR